MRKLILISVLLAPLGATGAFAGGGMGDPSTILKQKAAICEMQRRGEGPLYPNLCQDEGSYAPSETRRSRRMN